MKGRKRVTGGCDETQIPSKTQGRSGKEGGSIQSVLQGCPTVSHVWLFKNEIKVLFFLKLICIIFQIAIKVSGHEYLLSGSDITTS